MKSSITGLAILISLNFCFSQGKKATDAQLERRVREISSNSYSPYTTEFNNMDLNFVNNKVQKFLNLRLDMALTEDSHQSVVTDSCINISESYHSTKINEKSRKLTFTYSVKAEEGSSILIVHSCKITGDKSSVIDFYIKYWDTTLDFDNTKKEEFVVNHWINDRIALTWNLQGAFIQVAKR